MKNHALSQDAPLNRSNRSSESIIGSVCWGRLISGAIAIGYLITGFVIGGSVMLLQAAFFLILHSPGKA
jgi:hypothetical protein